MVIITTTCAISAYHYKRCDVEPRSGVVYWIQHYVISCVIDSPGSPFSTIYLDQANEERETFVLTVRYFEYHLDFPFYHTVILSWFKLHLINVIYILNLVKILSFIIIITYVFFKFFTVIVVEIFFIVTSLRSTEQFPLSKLRGRLK